MASIISNMVFKPFRLNLATADSIKMFKFTCAEIPTSNLLGSAPFDKSLIYMKSEYGNDLLNV